MPDDKVKAAERREIDVGHLSVDRNAFMFTIYVNPPVGPRRWRARSRNRASHRGLVVPPSPGTQVTVDTRTGATVGAQTLPTFYAGFCSEQHDQGAQGVDHNGHWSTGILASYHEARTASNGHEHAVNIPKPHGPRRPAHHGVRARLTGVPHAPAMPIGAALPGGGAVFGRDIRVRRPPSLV